MALPIANLGYMPNISTPSGGGHYVKPNPWLDLVTAALGQVVQSGVKNEFSTDYTDQAQKEGLAVDPEAKKAGFIQKFLGGPTTSEAQLGQLRSQQSSQQLEGTRQVGETARTKATLGTTKEEGKATRETQQVLQNRQLSSQEAQGGAQRANEQLINANTEAGAMQRLQAEISSQERQLGRKLTAEEQQTVTRGFLDNVGQIVSKQNPMAPMINESMKSKGLPSLPTTDEQVSAYADALKKLGFNVIPPQSSIPPVPMIRQ